MFDANAKLLKFYDDHVRLGADLRGVLAGHRDACLDRLEAGLAKLAEEGKKAGPFERPATLQGSYVMHTLNQQRDNDYDLDVGVIFDEEAIPSTALDARKRVLEGLERGGGNFAKPPEARLNAVTVYYADGHHIDIAVYRRTTHGQIQHASAGWKNRDPDDVTEWFKRRVKDREPPAATVPEGQLRRLVRYLKAFAKSRPSWSLPGGMIITTLVSEAACVDGSRDDLALHETMASLFRRLSVSTTVISPVDPTQELTAKPEYAAQVTRLRNRLGEALERLKVLSNPSCTEAEAMNAWGWVFRHEYWSAAKDEAAEQAELGSLRIEAAVANVKEGGTHRGYFATSPLLPKKVWLRFRLRDTSGLDGAKLKWTVQNSGDEAEAANQISHYTFREVGEDHWESTAYKGTHAMVCEAYRNGIKIAEGRRRVRVGSR